MVKLDRRSCRVATGVALVLRALPAQLELGVCRSANFRGWCSNLRGHMASPSYYQYRVTPELMRRFQRHQRVIGESLHRDQQIIERSREIVERSRALLEASDALIAMRHGRSTDSD